MSKMLNIEELTQCSFRPLKDFRSNDAHECTRVQSDLTRVSSVDCAFALVQNVKMEKRRFKKWFMDDAKTMEVRDICEKIFSRSQPFDFEIIKRGYIYFLIRKSRIVYIGQSTLLFNRLPQHYIDKKFDMARYIEIPKVYLDTVERILINEHMPEYNCLNIRPYYDDKSIMESLRSMLAGMEFPR